ncbi:MAG: aquaporin [Candidatus Saccharibacteria bacterium]|nr:aquaporin [Candidatus Saccharibacteria bacterium]
MATKKPKTSAKSVKTKATKSKTAAKTVEKPVSEATKITTEKTVTETPAETKSEPKEKAEKTEKVGGDSFLKGFFAKKYEEKESILTVFKKPKFYGALLGEVLGTALITLTLFSLLFMGVYDIARFAGFAVIAVYVMVYAFSGAFLNPIVAVGMMATRRISAIRGVMYIVAEIIGAWIGWLVFNLFHLAGGEGTTADLPALAAIVEGKFWVTAMIEFLGATIIAFSFVRALEYKRSIFTFAATIAGGLILAFITCFSVSYFYLGLSGNFMLNPAVALMSQIFPTSGENFGEILGGICQALSVYALFPMLGGVLGFYLSDFTDKLTKAE